LGLAWLHTSFRVSGRQLFTALGTAVGQDLATAHRLHAGTKPVPALADQFRRLIGALHNDSPKTMRTAAPRRVCQQARRRVRLHQRPVESGALYGCRLGASISACCSLSQESEPKSTRTTPFRGRQAGRLDFVSVRQVWRAPPQGACPLARSVPGRLFGTVSDPRCVRHGSNGTLRSTNSWMA
jgi:hypothetical protein